MSSGWPIAADSTSRDTSNSGVNVRVTCAANDGPARDGKTISVVRMATTVPTATSIIRFSAEAMGGPRRGSPSTTMAAVTQAMRSDGRRAEKKPSTSTVTASPANFNSCASASATATAPPTTTPSKLPKSRSAARPSEAPTLACVTRIAVITAQKPCGIPEGIDDHVGQAGRDRGLDGEAQPRPHLGSRAGPRGQIDHRRCPCELAPRSIEINRSFSKLPLRQAARPGAASPFLTAGAARAYHLGAFGTLMDIVPTHPIERHRPRTAEPAIWSEISHEVPSFA